MNETVVWTPVPSWPAAAFVPKTTRFGLRRWTADGPSDPDALTPPREGIDGAD